MSTAQRTPRLYLHDADDACRRVRAHLEVHRVEYVAVLVPVDVEERTELLDLTGQRNVPVLADGEILVIGERPIVAYVERRFVHSFAAR